MLKIDKPKTKFQKWFYKNLLKNKMTCIDVANELHISRQTVVNHYKNETKISYVNFIGYCVLFNYNPKITYKKLFGKEA